MDPETRFAHLLSRCREGGHRITPQRVALLRLLAFSKEHPTAAQLYAELREHFPTTSLATVYKTLNFLTEMGEVRVLPFESDEKHFDGLDPSLHPHLICIYCHSIVDAHEVEDEAQSLTQALAQKSGFQILRHRLDFFGICPKCQEQNPDKHGSREPY